MRCSAHFGISSLPGRWSEGGRKLVDGWKEHGDDGDEVDDDHEGDDDGEEEEEEEEQDDKEDGEGRRWIIMQQCQPVAGDGGRWRLLVEGAAAEMIV